MYYIVIYESGGQTITTYTAQAESAERAQAKSQAFFRDYPEYDFRNKYTDIKVRVEIAPSATSKYPPQA
jgi:hypothetical protein